MKNIYTSVLNRMKDINKYLEHTTVKGSSNVIILRDLLKDYLPNKYNFTLEQTLIDRSGNQSKESDLIIYDPTTQSKFFKHDHGFIPIYSVHAVIEVKTTLNKTELEKAILNIKKMKEMEIIKGKSIINPSFYQDKNEIREVTHPIGIIFAFQQRNFGKQEQLAKNIKEIINKNKLRPEHLFDLLYIFEEGTTAGWGIKNESGRFIFISPEIYKEIFEIGISTIGIIKENQMLDKEKNSSLGLFSFFQLLDQYLSEKPMIHPSKVTQQYLRPIPMRWYSLPIYFHKKN